MKYAQVIPLNDERLHKPTEDCWCEPKLKLFDGEMVLSHNSADHREFVERVLGEGIEGKGWLAIGGDE